MTDGTPEVLDSKTLTPFSSEAIACWRGRDGREWTRAKSTEQPVALVIPRTTGLSPLPLVPVATSAIIKAARKKLRKAARELSKRGYA